MLPTQWGKTENIRWSVKLPGWGRSSPIVYGNRVFITSELNQEDKKSPLTLGFDRTDDLELRGYDFGSGVNQRVHEKSNLAVTTEEVHVAFGNAEIARRPRRILRRSTSRAARSSDTIGGIRWLGDLSCPLATQTAYVRGMAASVPNSASPSSWRMVVSVGIDLPPT